MLGSRSGHRHPTSLSRRRVKAARSTMPTPAPPVALKDHCSIIYNNTLYTYQVDAFQSLELKNGAEWLPLPLGVPTNGSTCLQGTADGQDALFIVGGTNPSSSPGFSGLQRYTFHDEKWQSCDLQTAVTQNRTLHGSTFLNSSSSILIYGGSQGSTKASSETFTISTNPPFNVAAHSSEALPVANPLIMPWNDTSGLILGGNVQNRELWTFEPSAGWHRLNVTLPNELPDYTKVQTALMSGDDGSKVLEIFDMSQSPNKITTLLLQNPTHSSIPSPSSRLPSSSPTSTASLGKVTVPPKREKRGTVPADRPAYNSTLAPQETRSGFSLAQGSDGLIIVSGGNDQDVLSMFNQTGNQWIDPNLFFTQSKTTNTDTTPSSVSPTSSLTGKPPPSSLPPPSNNGSRNRSLTILGATLGAVFGVAALLVLMLLLIRCIRKRREDKRPSNAYSMDNKDDMDFMDRGADLTKEAGGSFGKQGSHKRDLSGQSASSVVIMGGKRNSSQQSKRALFNKAGNSDGSTKPFFGRSKSPVTTSPPQISEQPMNNYPKSPNPRTEPRTDAGFSKYYDNSSSNVNALAVGPTRHESQSRPTTFISTSQSDYSSSRVTSSQPHESAEVKPLNLSSTQLPSNSRMVSPTSGLPLQTGVAVSSDNRGQPPTPTSLVSDIDEEEEYRPYQHRALEPESTSSWTPIDTSDRGSTWQDRPVSSVYTDSMIYPHPGERVRIPNFPGVPSRRPSQARSNLGRSNSNRGIRSAAAKDSALPASRPPQPPAAPMQDPPNTRRVLPGYGTHEIRSFPRRTEELGPTGRGGRDTEDMSWLNLGASK